MRAAGVAVGVDVTVSTAVAAITGRVAVLEAGISVWTVSAGLLSVVEDSPVSTDAVPPRRGDRSSRVVAGCRFSDATVSEGSRCRPASRIRTSEGKFAEAERKSRTSDMEFEGRTFSGMAVRLHRQQVFQRGWRGRGLGSLFPPAILTKIGTLSAGRDEAEDVEEDRERMVSC